MKRVIANPERAHQLVEQYGSPLHIVVASEFRRNVADLLAPIAARGLKGGIYFARKANKLPWFVTAAKEEGIGVDTASIDEVQETLQLGIDPQKLIVTAVGKERKLITLAIKAGCLLVIDNDDELQLVGAIASELGTTARIGLRFAGFVVNGRAVFSRFGLPVAECAAILQRVAATPALKLEILHAHLDRYDTTERAGAARYLLEISDHAKQLGLAVKGIDLGGGILIRYLDDETQWVEFQKALLEAVGGERPPFTYLADGLGFIKAAGEIHGNADLYPAFNNLSKERFIAAVLDDTASGTPLHEEIAARNLQIFFEPGRALLDNTGITLSTVTYRKTDTLGNQIIGTAMNRFNLRPFRAEFCCDPYFLARKTVDGDVAEEAQLADGAFLAGSLCSESDVIYRRKLNIGTRPRLGDIVCFPNTAGYLMHHLEVGTHGNPLPVNILINPETLRVEDSLGSRG